MSTRRVDHKSGQLYTEQAMAPAVAFAMGPSWVHENPFPSVEWQAGSKPGPPSLKHLAINQLLSDQRNLTPQLFANVPWRIASYLWDCFGKCRKRTFYIWKLFATAYPVQFRQIAQFRSVKFKEPQMPMRDYLGLVKSDSLSWRLALTLTTSFARVPELVEISSIKNLVALEITTPRIKPVFDDDTEAQVTTLNDRIVRTWSELAETSGAFAHLRVLRLYHQDNLSMVILRFLKTFPSLHFVIAHDCPNLNSILAKNFPESDEWQVATDPHLVKGSGDELDQLESDTLYECYQASFMTGIGENERKRDCLVRDGPILDCQIGQATRKRTNNNKHHQSVIYLQRRRSPVSASLEPSSKKLKLAARPQAQARASKRPVVKERNRKDIRDILEEFL